jgi:magnesium transporter
LLRSLSTDEVKSVLDGMPPDDRTRFFEEMPAAVTRQLLEVLSPEELKNARQLLGYPEHSVGLHDSLHDYVAIHPEMTAAEALDTSAKLGTEWKLSTSSIS